MNANNTNGTNLRKYYIVYNLLYTVLKYYLICENLRHLRHLRSLEIN